MSDYRANRVGFLPSANRNSLVARILVLFVLAFSIAGAAVAQENRGTITGTITDAQGASIAGAKVQAKNLGTQVTYDSVTTDAGVYTIPLVPPGNYSVTASHDGFKSSVNPGFEVRVSDHVQIDLSLEVGVVTQEVTVTTQVPLLETATASRGAVLDSQEVSDLPLEGRTISLLATVEAGVQYTNTTPSSSARPFDNGLIENIQVNGGRSARNNYLLNGISNTAQELTTSYMNIVLEAPPDAVGEVRVQTSEVDAQYGHTAGGIIDVNTKSGTNQVHGAAYYFARSDALNANYFQNNKDGIARPAFKWEQPGLEFDGPVVIPHLYNGRNKTFFMVAWEHIIDAVPNPLTSTVPTLAERSGDFSHDTINGAPITIYSPCYIVGPPACTRQQVSYNGMPNVIPPNLINPIAAKIAAYWPMPTPGAGNADHLNNYVNSSPQTDTYNVYTYQVDQTINANNRLTATYATSDRPQRQGDVGIAEVASTGYYLERINHVAGVAWSSTLSPTTVLSLRYGFSRHELTVNAFGGELGASGLTGLGFPSSFVSQIPFPSFPNITFAGGTTYLPLGGTQGLFGGNQRNFSTNNAVSGAVTKIANKHSLTMGGEVNFVQNDRHSATALSFVFSPVFSQSSANSISSSQGDGFADFLMGFPGQQTGTSAATLSGSQPINVSPAYENRYIAGFVQDNWRVSSRLTLNLGLRWDIETPVTDRYNRLNAGFNPLAPVTNFPVSGLLGGLLFTSPGNRAPFSKDWGDWQPRLGIAYKINDKTVLRAGYAKFYLPSMADQGYSQGFSTTNPYDPSDNGNFFPANSLSNPFPNGLVQPTGSSLGTGTALGTGINFSSTYRPLPYTKSFSVGFERQLPSGFVLDLSYVGSRTRRLETSVNIDALSTSNLALGASMLNAQVGNPFAGLLPGTSLNGGTTTKQQLLLPFPQFTSVTENNLPVGYSWYNSLQARLEHRFKSGLFFQASLTYSKNMEAISYLNPQDYYTNPYHLLRVVTSDDAPYRLRMSGGYRFPSLRSENFLVRGVLDGWQLNAVFTLQSGVPVAAPSGAFSTGLNPALSHRTSKLYFNNCYINTSHVLSSQCAANGLQPAWIQQPAFTLNTLTTRMSSVRLDEPANVDLSLFKSWPIHERVQMQFRAEAFNFTNTAYFNLSNGTTLTSGLFGTESPNQSNDPREIQLSLRVQF